MKIHVNKKKLYQEAQKIQRFRIIQCFANMKNLMFISLSKVLSGTKFVKVTKIDRIKQKILLFHLL